MLTQKAGKSRARRDPRYLSPAQIGAMIGKQPSARRALMAELEANFGLRSFGRGRGKRYERWDFERALDELMNRE